MGGAEPEPDGEYVLGLLSGHMVVAERSAATAVRQQDVSTQLTRGVQKTT